MVDNNPMTNCNRTEINRRQKEFYETKRKNLTTRLWSYFRNGILNKTRKKLGIEDQVYELHKSWLGKLSNKKVLDLGCFSGNALSIYLAKNAREYIAIDLSESGIEQLNKRLVEFPKAQALSIDFLSPNFQEKDFDVIYAYGVLHHFEDTVLLISKLKEKLKSGGVVISNDPLETSLPIRIIRRIYRPFQTDKDWEWPFSRKVYYQYAQSFDITERRAVLGKAKWTFLINLLPLSLDRKNRIGRRWHEYDWKRSEASDSHMFSCMHLTMLMKKN